MPKLSRTAVMLNVHLLMQRFRDATARRVGNDIYLFVRREKVAAIIPSYRGLYIHDYINCETWSIPYVR